MQPAARRGTNKGLWIGGGCAREQQWQQQGVVDCDGVGNGERGWGVACPKHGLACPFAYVRCESANSFQIDRTSASASATTRFSGGMLLSSASRCSRRRAVDARAPRATRMFRRWWWHVMPYTAQASSTCSADIASSLPSSRSRCLTASFTLACTMPESLSAWLQLSVSIAQPPPSWWRPTRRESPIVAARASLETPAASASLSHSSSMPAQSANDSANEPSSSSAACPTVVRAASRTIRSPSRVTVPMVTVCCLSSAVPSVWADANVPSHEARDAASVLAMRDISRRTVRMKFASGRCAFSRSDGRQYLSTETMLCTTAAGGVFLASMCIAIFRITGFARLPTDARSGTPSVTARPTCSSSSSTCSRSSSDSFCAAARSFFKRSLASSARPAAASLRPRAVDSLSAVRARSRARLRAAADSALAASRAVTCAPRISARAFPLIFARFALSRSTFDTAEWR